MKTFLYKSIVLVILCASCNLKQANKSTQNQAKQYQKQVLRNKKKLFVINLDSFKTILIKKYNSIEFKTFDRSGEKDSLRIGNDLHGKLLAKYIIKGKSDEESDVILSEFKLYSKGSLVFVKDSILAITPFDLNESKKLLSFSVMYSQRQDTFITASDLFVMDLDKNKIVYSKDGLANTVNAPFLKNQSIYYFNDGTLYDYDFLKKSTDSIFKIVNNYTILNVKVLSESAFEIVYLKDIADQELYKTIITL